MPVEKVKGGYRYGSKGKVYRSKSDAEKQGRAIGRSLSSREKIPRKKKQKSKNKSVLKKF